MLPVSHCHQKTLLRQVHLSTQSCLLSDCWKAEVTPAPCLVGRSEKKLSVLRVSGIKPEQEDYMAAYYGLSFLIIIMSLLKEDPS